MLQGGANGKETARKVRREMSLPEVLLWQRLRLRPKGLKFRRQHPAGPYVLDFYCHDYCHDARLIVEIDGISHDMGDRPDRDELRDKWFANKGIRTLRVPATDVLKDADATAAAVAAYAGEE